MDEDIDNLDEVLDEDEDEDEDDEEDLLEDLDEAEEAEEGEEEDEDEDEETERETLVRETPAPSQKRLNVHVIPPDERRTSDMMSLFELAAVIGTRAQQIENGDISFCGDPSLSKAIDIAERELIERRCPLVIERTVFTSKDDIFVEHWRVNELGIPQSELTIQ